ncbi:hypothetical protein KSS87_022397, partial [Heliosperma pusillum]
MKQGSPNQTSKTFTTKAPGITLPKHPHYSQEATTSQA